MIGINKPRFHVQVQPFTRFKAVDVRFLSTSSTSIIKPWKVDMVQSDGDYRKEAFLEDYIGGALYENQKILPRLPIPTIEDTLKRFLPTALPLARTEEERAALLAACESFPDQANILQERLFDRRDNEMKDSSWLQQWWNQVGACRSLLQMLEMLFSYPFHLLILDGVFTISRFRGHQCVVLLSVPR